MKRDTQCAILTCTCMYQS